MLGHPSKHDLVAYAESRMPGGEAISAKVGRHVTGCATCAREVAAISASLAFVAQADPLEPSADLTANILAAGHRERANARRMHNRRRSVLLLTKGLACAASMVVVTAVAFSAALDERAPTVSVRPTTEPVQISKGPSPEEIRQATARAQTLAAAVVATSAPPRSVREWQQQRAAQALGADYQAALAAFESNPASARARRLVASNIERRTQALKTLYVERSI